jgi:hypothetical protein
MNTIPRLLAAYDAELRTDAETANAIQVRMLGPLLLATFSRGRGFITYRDLGGADSETIRSLVLEVLEHFRADSSVESVEWKTRAHDVAPNLDQILTSNGFIAGEAESIMIGEAKLLAIDVELPQGVSLRKIESDEDVYRMAKMQAEVFGDSEFEPMAKSLIQQLALKEGLELWAAEFNNEIISAGRIDPVKGTGFAGIWGGATQAKWQGKGIYRALTAARARSAMAAGKTWIQSDSTEFSRPILERSGFLKVSETTPYVWKRGG